MSSVTERCIWCERPVQRRWWDRWTSTPTCPPEDAEACTLLALAMRLDPPDPDYGPEDPAPADLWDCTCLGGAVVLGQDWETGAMNTEECVRCHGTGVLLPI